MASAALALVALRLIMTAAVAIEAMIEMIREQIIRMASGLAEEPESVTTGHLVASVLAVLSLHLHDAGDVVSQAQEVLALHVASVLSALQSTVYVVSPPADLVQAPVVAS